ncbi:MAG: hypothetical protein ABGY75_21265 [Gemmataceae bacterium]
MGYLFLIVFAAVGLAASVVCHALGWLGVEPPGGKAAVGLHVGIFVVWIPLCLLANRTIPKGKEATEGNMNHLAADLPRWAGAAMIGVFVYALVNFALFMWAAREFPRGKVPFPLELRGASGHWMMFYGWALCGMVSLRRLARKRAAEGSNGEAT